jgi:hypothetical protein
MGTPGRKRIEGLISRRRERNGSREQAEGLPPEVQGKLSSVGRPLVSDAGHTAMYVNNKEQKPAPKQQVTGRLRFHDPLGVAIRRYRK